MMLIRHTLGPPAGTTTLGHPSSCPKIIQRAQVQPEDYTEQEERDKEEEEERWYLRETKGRTIKMRVPQALGCSTYLGPWRPRRPNDCGP